MANGHEQQASMGQVKSLIRRRLRRQEPPTENSLNIYPMMDMMTILLVFLIMQFAAGTADVSQSSELLLPYSDSHDEHRLAVSVKISRTQIVVGSGETAQPVIDLRNGQVDPSAKQGGGTGFLITQLLNVMQQHADLRKQVAQARGQPFRGEVQIIADKRTPFRTLAEVLYTVGQAEFKVIRFVVLQQ